MLIGPIHLDSHVVHTIGNTSKNPNLGEVTKFVFVQAFKVFLV